MEVHNFDHGVKLRNAAGAQYNIVDVFYPKNTARLVYYTNLSYLVCDPLRFQSDFTFVRSDITLIKSNGAAVAIPGDDDALFDLLASYLFSTQEPITGGTIPITGADYLVQLADNEKTFLFNEPPTMKTFTIPAGLPVDFKVRVIKMYPSGSITMQGTGGMVPSGGDLTLNQQFSVMEILIVAPAVAVCINTGG